MDSLYKVKKTLSNVAMGREPAQLVIRGAKLVNVCTAEIQSSVDIAVSCGKVAFIGDATHCIGENTTVYDAKGAYAAPGFIDSHLHVESSMLTVREFAKAVVPSGTTAILMDPHEIANVMGVEGVELMLDDGLKTPLKVFSTVPSCVPACPAFEQVPHPLGREDIAELMTHENVGGLGEMMNYPAVINSDEDVHEILSDTLQSGKVLTGHYPAPAGDGKGLCAYIASGITTCHETTTPEDALAKMRLGMYAQIREGSAWHDVEQTIKCVTQQNVDTRYCVLCTDDTHPDTLLSVGHINHVVHRAIQEGVNPITAIQMATINAANSMNMPHLGSIAPSKCADIQLFSDLEKPVAHAVFIDGELVAEHGELLQPIEPKVYPPHVCATMHLPRELTAQDFAVKCEHQEVSVRVIGVGAGQVLTKAHLFDMCTDSGELKADAHRDIAKVAVIERHSGKGEKALGFVTGFGFKYGATAQTVAHDAHNLLVVGTNDEDMAIAANTLKECGGGIVVVKDKKVLALLPLPVAGIMSDKTAAQTAELISGIISAYEHIGCTMPSPFMTMGLLALAVIPELRITYEGVIDTVAFEKTSLFFTKQT